jgi:DtxR family Mn-dependent transcriptional regulator
MVMTLDCLEPGQHAEVVALRSADPARLDRLGAFGLVPGSVVHLEQRQPALIFRVGETELSVDRVVAREILVKLPGGG